MVCPAGKQLEAPQPSTRPHHLPEPGAKVRLILLQAHAAQLGWLLAPAALRQRRSGLSGLLLRATLSLLGMLAGFGLPAAPPGAAGHAAVLQAQRQAGARGHLSQCADGQAQVS